MRTFLFKTLQWLAQSLPLQCSYMLANFGGRIQCALSKQDRLAVESNLKTLLKRTPTKNETSQVFQRFGYYLVDFCRMTSVITPDYIKNNIDIEGVDYIDEVLNRGKGGVILTAHLGNWEVGGAVMAGLGYPFHAIALPHQQSGVNEWFNAQRKAVGVQAIPSQSAVRHCLGVLSQNKLVAVVADRDFSKQGVRMRFLDRDMMIPKGAAIFAYKTGAGVIPSFYYQQANGRWCLKCMPPVYADKKIKGVISDDDIVCFAQKYLPCFEVMIRKYATQWLMFREYGKEV